MVTPGDIKGKTARMKRSGTTVRDVQQVEHIMPDFGLGRGNEIEARAQIPSAQPSSAAKSGRLPLTIKVFESMTLEAPKTRSLKGLALGFLKDSSHRHSIQ